MGPFQKAGFGYFRRSLLQTLVSGALQVDARDGVSGVVRHGTREGTVLLVGRKRVRSRPERKEEWEVVEGRGEEDPIARHTCFCSVAPAVYPLAWHVAGTRLSATQVNLLYLWLDIEEDLIRCQLPIYQDSSDCPDRRRPNTPLQY